MTDASQFDRYRELLRSGRGFDPGEPPGDDADSRLLAQLREDLHIGESRYRGRALWAGFEPVSFFAEADDGKYDGVGARVPTGKLSGDVRVVTAFDRLTTDAGADTAPFSRRTVLIPGDNAVAVRLSAEPGVVEVVLTLAHPGRDFAWPAGVEEFALTCVAAGAADLDLFRTLAAGEWRRGAEAVFPRVGVPAPVGAPEVLRSVACRHLARTPIAGAERVIQLPLRHLAAAPGAEVVYRVTVGDDARTIARQLGSGAVRRNCLPVWNAALGGAERAGGAPPPIDPQPLRAVPGAVTILECLDPTSDRVFVERRFAADHDPAETFAVASVGEAGAALEFTQFPDAATFRVLYLAGLEPPGDVCPGASWLSGPGRLSLVARTAPAPAGDAARARATEFPDGHAVTAFELLEVVYRFAPRPVRDEWDAAARADVRDEIAVVDGHPFGVPTTLVTLPRKGDQRTDVGYFLDALGRQAGRYAGRRVVVRFDPPVGREVGRG